MNKEARILESLRDDLVGERGRLIEAMVSRGSWTLEEIRNLAELQGAVMALEAHIALPPKLTPTGPDVEFGKDGWPK